MSVRCLSMSLSVVILVALGCGSSDSVGTVGANANISGSVTWQGKPVELGMIFFEDPDSGEKTSYAIRDGKYSSYDAPLTLSSGEKIVRIYGGKYKTDQAAQKAGAGVMHSGGIVLDQLDNEIAAEYNTSSNETVTIQEGENTLDFALPK